MLVVNPAYDAVTDDWFYPEFWGEKARPVSVGGRGSAWFVDTDSGSMVLRHYRRGGLVARVSERNYVFTGWRRTRSWREFQLLKTLHDQGLPVPEPVAACASTYLGCFYHAAILIRRIEAALPLPEAPGLDDQVLWGKVGAMIRRFHDAGLDHVDLNCDNILVAADGVYLIDLDRCRLRSAKNQSDWADRNLSRLRRSIKKRIAAFTETQRDGQWSWLMEGYYKSPLSESRS